MRHLETIQSEVAAYQQVRAEMITAHLAGQIYKGTAESFTAYRETCFQLDLVEASLNAELMSIALQQFN